ncbi:hypothetical protein EYR36_005267 [Pleurotus pulmonarius]|nr:hypothetical protein EYR36_005267 [Pleurotus pulmonarius]
MPRIQNKRGISYAGAWLGYGFHEDGFTSGLRAAVAFDGVKIPFEILEPDRAPEDAKISYVFDLLEASGLRRLLGFSGSFWLGVWVGILGMFVDLSHLNEKATFKAKHG